MPKCPKCNGTTRIYGVDLGGAIGTPREQICYVCGGNGEVDRAKLFAIEKGESIRKKRLEFGLTVRNAAIILGCSESELLAVERGCELARIFK